MSIYNAMTNLAALQAGISITTPRILAVKKAFKFFPPTSVTVTDTPAWINTFDLSREDRHISFRELFYTIHMQLLSTSVGVEADEGADVATAFLEAFIDALDADMSLGNTITDHVLRGGSPTLTVLERGDAYIGLDLFLDVVIKSAKDFS